MKSIFQTEKGHKTQSKSKQTSSNPLQNKNLSSTRTFRNRTILFSSSKEKKKSKKPNLKTFKTL